ncbi:hypothetical protein [Croceibacterium aestuarii]|uniref:hypothetical protein n=1 Tax=Croceibacterium aestuarii TaxID=3064139 RepID=UPI00272E62A0|nr:hypothetical protein [Croceibacterium sp. D39]
MPESNTRWPAYARVPPFLPVPLRARAGGWTHQKQAALIGFLAETGCVAEAARRVGMSRMGAWRLRRRPGAAGLAHAWDTVMAYHAQASGHLRNLSAAEGYGRGACRVRLRRPDRAADAGRKVCRRGAQTECYCLDSPGKSARVQRRALWLEPRRCAAR